jgi:hypothetical protein
MKRILVQQKPKTSFGRLYPRYDDDSGILAVESRIKRPWPFGVDVDGTIVFDLDEARLLANFDLHIPRARWERSLPEEQSFATAEAADIEFTDETVRQKSFHLPIRARTDAGARRLLVQIGDARPTNSVALSERCVALLAGNELVGFLITGL